MASTFLTVTFIIDRVLPPAQLSQYKRSISSENKVIRAPSNANLQSRYVELVLVVDNGMYIRMNRTLKDVEDYCKTITNIVNKLYAPLNIFIALVGVVVWTEQDEISFSDSSDTTLSNFLHYRREKLIIEHPNDNAQLITSKPFSNGLVAKALKGPICTYEFSGGINFAHSNIVELVAINVAHSLGHNFGMEHDTDQCECPEDVCLMSTSTATNVSRAPTHWSSCSRDFLKIAFDNGMDHCLRNKPSTLYQSPTCGNEFLEDGEECDCGLPQYCNNTCCNANTCKLLSDAMCATGECCDLQTCKLKTPGNTCRQEINECDLPEYCNGESEFCPSDVHKMDSEICKSGQGYCYQGHCGTHSDQCKLLWGDSGKSSELCYKLNTRGNRHGNCGFKKLNNSFEKCDEKDILCGLLHCQHYSTGLLYGMESVSILSHAFINSKGTILPCRSAMVDLGLSDPDPGMVPNGAKCGDDKMCVNQKCVSVSTLQDTHGCPHNCYGNGWCNNLGHCHCKAGYLLPYCQHLYPGGSIDSGLLGSFNNISLLL